MKQSQTPGGKRLRSLRHFYNKTQLDIELEAGLGIGYLQRLELGRVKQPERETIERILTALNAHYIERRDLLELFGYVVDMPLPDDEAIQWAISVCHDELTSVQFPAYLLDCGHRLLYWNTQTSRLFDTSVADHVSMLKLVFDASYHWMPKIKNEAEFLPAQIRALRYEMQHFHNEDWYEALIDDMLSCQTFRHYWQAESEKMIQIPARPLTPLELEVDQHILSFRLISEPFVQDNRFRVIFYLPTDAQTIQQCLDWSQ
ncbi:hypothetical protein G4Y79_19825 [Phototrophicus methaneseepsis]|uniref:HTH cro/C1-type domain-containing protein n=1 Tax=Phototrophicus methaneseepsis TaxID=2710758 RepID=A0A7S8IE01_9CHLR|nr:helix-turn-helix transcriptional regulator [Phototrophicus methaneseepsis]QPC81914.1 hypothetical protein G4Y79_19825 [Phototrophicus methaneseepsis]